MVHELVGHANMLASPAFADLYQLAGQPSRRAETEPALEFFSRAFWFSFEFGVAWEGDELRTYGAGLLSSFSELDAFPEALRSASSTSLQWERPRTSSRCTSPCCSPVGPWVAWSTSLASFLSTYDDDRYLELVN